MKKLLLLSVFIFSTIIHSMDNNNNRNSMTINTIDDVPAQCLAMMVKLYEQKEKKYYRYDSQKVKGKILLMDNYEDCMILRIINELAAEISTDTSVKVDAFGEKSPLLYVLYSKKFLQKKVPLGEGILLCSNNKTMPRLDVLLNAYKMIIVNLKTNWQKKEGRRTKWQTPKDYITILSKKHMSIAEEDLIEILASKMGIANKIIAFKGLMVTLNQPLYIKRMHFKEVRDKFGFDCFPNPQDRRRAMLVFKKVTELPEKFKLPKLPAEIAKEIVLLAYPYWNNIA